MRITWWGHSTCTVELGGVRVLTDPVLTARLAHLVRQDLPNPPDKAAVADVVVVSHLHADHLHLPSLLRVGPQTRLVVPQGAAALLAKRAPRLALRLDEVGPGDRVRVGDVEIIATHAEHDGRRMPGSRFHGPALGFVLQTDDARVWFAGDTGLFDEMAALAPVDVALVPVGGWGPTLGPHHLDPSQAAEAVRRVGAADAVAVHYGTFWPMGLRAVAPKQFREKCLEPGERFAAALADLEPAARAHVLAPGTSVELPGRRR